MLLAVKRWTGLSRHVLAHVRFNILHGILLLRVGKPKRSLIPGTARVEQERTVALIRLWHCGRTLAGLTRCRQSVGGHVCWLSAQ